MRKAGGFVGRPSPAMIVAVIALVAAFGGVAVALPGRNSVKSKDIAPHAVKRSDIARAAVDPFRTSVVKDGAVNSTLSTTSNSPVDLGGPSVTVKVPKGALVGIFAEANLQVAGGGPSSEAQVRLF